MSSPASPSTSAPRGLPADDPADGFDRAGRALLLLACALATLRFVLLGRWSLWIDEAYTLADAMHPAPSLNPLGYRLFAVFYGALAQRPDELLLRLPAALFGWLCVPLTAWCLAPLVRPRAASLAALVVALSPWHLYWSQNARFYTMAQALALLGLGLLLRGLGHRTAGRAAWGAVVGGLLALGALLATHPSAGLLGAPAIPLLLAARARGPWPTGARSARGLDGAWWCLLLAGGGGLVAGLPWAQQVWAVWSERQGSGDPLHLVKSAGYLVGPGLGLGALVGASWALRRRRSGERLLARLVLVALLFALGVSFFVRVSAQYVFVQLPLVAGLAAAPLGVRWGGRAAKLRGALYVSLLLLPPAVESGMYFTLRHGDRPRWREAYAHVFEHREWNDLVLGMQAPVAQYYWAPWSDDPRRWDQVVQLDSIRAGVPREWMRYERTIWFVVNLEQLADWDEAERRRLLELFARACTLEASFEVPWTPRDLDVHVFRRDPRGAP